MEELGGRNNNDKKEWKGEIRIESKKKIHKKAIEQVVAKNKCHDKINIQNDKRKNNVREITGNKNKVILLNMITILPLVYIRKQ